MLSTVTCRFSVVLMTTIALITSCASLQAEPSPTAEARLNQTGAAELDRIITVALEGDVTELRSLLEFTSTTCTFAEGLGGPPKCLDSEQEGEPVEVLPFLSHEGYFIRKADIDTWAGLEVSELFAVYQVSEAAYTDVNYPSGEYALVFIGNLKEQTSITLQVRRGRIVRVDYGFGYPPEIPQEYVVRYLMPPGNTNP